MKRFFLVGLGFALVIVNFGIVKAEREQSEKIAFFKVREITKKEKFELNLIENEIIEESDYNKIKDYNTQVLYLEIIEINESNIKEQIPVKYKKAGKTLSVDKNRNRLILYRELADKKGKKIKLFNKGKTKKVFLKYIIKYNDGRFPCDSEKIDIFEVIPNKIVSYKEYIPPARYFGIEHIENFKSFRTLEINLKSLSSTGEIIIDIKSDEIKNNNIKIAINQTKILEFSERKIDLTKYGDLKKINSRPRSSFKLPEEMVVKTTLYITNYGFYSIFGRSTNE